MKDLSATVMDAALKQRAGQQPNIILGEITLPDFEVVRVANYDIDVTFETESDGTTPLVWQAFHLAIGNIVDTKRGDMPQIQVAISNVTLELMRRIDAAAGLTDQWVRILMVNGGTLADSNARILYRGQVVNTDVDEQTVVLHMGRPKLNRASFPARRCLSKCSVVRFGDAACGYVIPESPAATNVVGGGFDFCPRDPDACQQRGDDEEARGLPRQHPRRFDGFPGTKRGNP